MQLISAFSIKIAGIPLRCSVMFNGCVDWFSHFITIESPVNEFPIAVPERLLHNYCKENDLGEGSAMDEYHLLHYEVSKALLPYHRCIFHGVAFIWQEKAYILTAPSGTGKSTQFKNWKKLYGRNVQIINGDKPALEFCNDKSIVVHPSPWNGKERFHGYMSAPLAGVIYLEQGNENSIELLDKQKAVIPILRQFIFTPDSISIMKQICHLEELLLNSIPVWKLTNLGDLESTKLTYDTLTKWKEGNHV